MLKRTDWLRSFVAKGAPQDDNAASHWSPARAFRDGVLVGGELLNVDGGLFLDLELDGLGGGLAFTVSDGERVSGWF